MFQFMLIVSFFSKKWNISFKMSMWNQNKDSTVWSRASPGWGGNHMAAHTRTPRCTGVFLRRKGRFLSSPPDQPHRHLLWLSLSVQDRSACENNRVNARELPFQTHQEVTDSESWQVLQTGGSPTRSGIRMILCLDPMTSIISQTQLVNCLSFLPQ